MERSAVDPWCENTGLPSRRIPWSLFARIIGWTVEQRRYRAEECLVTTMQCGPRKRRVVLLDLLEQHRPEVFRTFDWCFSNWYATAHFADGDADDAARTAPPGELSLTAFALAVGKTRRQIEHVVARGRLPIRRVGIGRRAKQVVPLDLAWDLPEYRHALAAHFLGAPELEEEEDESDDPRTYRRSARPSPRARDGRTGRFMGNPAHSAQVGRVDSESRSSHATFAQHDAPAEAPARSR